MGLVIKHTWLSLLKKFYMEWCFYVVNTVESSQLCYKLFENMVFFILMNETDIKFLEKLFAHPEWSTIDLKESLNLKILLKTLFTLFHYQIIGLKMI